jgi:gliding motility-associated-like protein
MYFKSLTPPFCVIDTDFDITIIPNLDLGKFENVFDCKSYTLPQLTAGEYFTETNGKGTKLNAGDVINTTQNIYVYADSSNGCISQASFSVIIGLETPTDISQCEPYTLPSLAVGNYYTEPQGKGTLIPDGTILNTSQTVYIYVASKNNPNCTEDIHFNISIAQPIIDVLENVNACESYTLPVISNGEYFTGPNGSGSKLSAGDMIFSNQTIYIYKKSATAADCSNEIKFEVTVNPKPFISSRSDIDICNYYELTNLQYGNYYTGPNGTGNMLPAGTKITTTQRIYIYAVSNDGSGCASENSFNIIIYPIEADSPANVSVCDSYTLPPLTIGNYYTKTGGPVNNNANLLQAGDVITQTTTLFIYAESGERINCTDENTFTITITKSPVVAPIADVFACDSFTLPSLTLGNYYTGPKGTGTQLNAGDIITTEQTIYVFAKSAANLNCTDEKSFKVNLFNVEEINDVIICENYTLNKLTIGNYYTQPNAKGQMLKAGDIIKNSQLIYIYAKNPVNTSCFDESSFNVTIVKTPQVFPIPNTLITVCDQDGLNDGITQFNLTQLNTNVLGTQTSSEFKVEYFASQNDAVLGVNSFTSTDLTKVYIKVSNTLTTNCYDIKNIIITVNQLPEPKPTDGIICYNSKTDTLLNPYTIQSGLNASDYTFEWLDENNNTVGNSSNYVATLPGIYHIKATSLATGCSSEAIPVLVSNSEPAIVSYSVSEDFADVQTITIVAQGVGGDYEYKLDEGEFQDSPAFYNVESGEHTIIVRDKNGCGNTTTEAIVINYPKFFTPNSDGYHDTWNIKDLKGFDNSEIFIYDRYGKLITNIKPNSQGWDGSLAGKNLPSTDYWFVVNYNKDGNIKEFKSHFTLKR